MEGDLEKPVELDPVGFNRACLLRAKSQLDHKLTALCFKHKQYYERQHSIHNPDKSIEAPSRNVLFLELISTSS